MGENPPDFIVAQREPAEMRFRINAQTFSHRWQLPARLTGEWEQSGRGIPADARYKPGSGELIAFVPSLDLVVIRKTGSGGPEQGADDLSRELSADLFGFGSVSGDGFCDDLLRECVEVFAKRLIERDELGPELVDEGRGDSHHDRVPALSQVAIRAQPIAPEQCQEELSRPGVFEREAILGWRIRNLERCKALREPPESVGRCVAFAIGSRPSMKSLDAPDLLEKLRVLVHWS